MSVILFVLAWALFASSLITTLLYGIFTPWNTHPVGKGFFWSMVAWTTIIFITNTAPILVALTDISSLQWVAGFGYCFMIWALWWGIIRHIIREQFINPAKERRRLMKHQGSHCDSDHQGSHHV